MKKIVLNISDSTYEKLCFEAIFEEKDIPTVLAERLLHKPFHPEVLEAYEEFFEQEIKKITDSWKERKRCIQYLAPIVALILWEKA